MEILRSTIPHQQSNSICRDTCQTRESSQSVTNGPCGEIVLPAAVWGQE